MVTYKWTISNLYLPPCFTNIAQYFEPARWRPSLAKVGMTTSSSSPPVFQTQRLWQRHSKQQQRKQQQTRQWRRRQLPWSAWTPAMATPTLAMMREVTVTHLVTFGEQQNCSHGTQELGMLFSGCFCFLRQIVIFRNFLDQ